jgi:CBS domain-containing protein
MLVRNICARPAVHVQRDASLREAAQLMERQQVGALVVVDAAGPRPVPIGVVTDRDLALAVLVADCDRDLVPVGQIMAPRPATCREDADLFDVIALMRKRGIRRVPVVDAHGVLTGLIAADDVVGALAEHLGELARALVSDELLEQRRVEFP